MSDEKAIVLRSAPEAICIRINGIDRPWVVHANHMPYLGEGRSPKEAWADALQRQEKANVRFG